MTRTITLALFACSCGVQVEPVGAAVIDYTGTVDEQVLLEFVQYAVPALWACPVTIELYYRDDMPQYNRGLAFYSTWEQRAVVPVYEDGVSVNQLVHELVHHRLCCMGAMYKHTHKEVDWKLVPILMNKLNDMLGERK